MKAKVEKVILNALLQRANALCQPLAPNEIVRDLNAVVSFKGLSGDEYNRVDAPHGFAEYQPFFTHLAFLMSLQEKDGGENILAEKTTALFLVAKLSAAMMVGNIFQQRHHKT